jgi:iron-sulfur cluster assembly protein
MFMLTSAAAQQIQQSAHASNAEHMALRVAARIGEEGTVEFGMGFDDPAESDLKLNLEGVDIVISTEHQELLDDTTLDFVELEPGDFNFIFVDSHPAHDVSVGGGCSTGGCGGGGCASKRGGCH